MNNFFDPSTAEAIFQRIALLNANSKAQWGKMQVAQMLAHCQQPLKIALGEVRGRRTLIGILFGGYARRTFVEKATPFKKDLPTDKNFLVSDSRVFQDEQERLMHYLRRFLAAGPEGMNPDPHPFFGKMTGYDWGVLTWKHLDHHLRQFGV